MSERVDNAIREWLSRSAVRNKNDGSLLNTHLQRLLRQVAMNVAAYNTGDSYYRESDIVRALETTEL